MKIGDLTLEELHRRFAGRGLRIKIGPFVVRLNTSVRGHVRDFSGAYADFPVCEENEISDFRIRVAPVFRWWPWRQPRRRWFWWELPRGRDIR